MPHQTFAQVIRRRLVGKDGQARLHELQCILAELPNYKNGPYADLRKWVNNEIDRTRVRKKVVHRDTIAVRREGAAQVALVGAPNAGKSSLLQALSSVQIKTGAYAFTTTRPVPATTRIGGVRVQFVEIPGLLEGASDGRGGGRALLGVLRGADAIVFCHPVDEPIDALDLIRAEVDAASIDVPAMIAATKFDETTRTSADAIHRHTGLAVVPVSILDDDSLEHLRAAVWRLTGLIRILPRVGSELADEPIALKPPVTVVDVAHAIHGELGEQCIGARVWGSSARFAGQRVGRAHRLAEDDQVEILTHDTVSR